MHTMCCTACARVMCTYLIFFMYSLLLCSDRKCPATPCRQNKWTWYPACARALFLCLLSTAATSLKDPPASLEARLTWPHPHVPTCPVRGASGAPVAPALAPALAPPLSALSAVAAVRAASVFFFRRRAASGCASSGVPATVRN